MVLYSRSQSTRRIKEPARHYKGSPYGFPVQKRLYSFPMLMSQKSLERKLNALATLVVVETLHR